MFYLDTQTNTRYYLRRAFSYGSLQYSQAAATHETFTTLGFTQVIIASRPDSRFYIVVGPDNTGAYSSTPLDLAELKALFIFGLNECILLNSNSRVVINNIFSKDGV